jgi:ubiquitin C-terminal hydrolase
MNCGVCACCELTDNNGEDRHENENEEEDEDGHAWGHASAKHAIWIAVNSSRVFCLLCKEVVIVPTNTNTNTDNNRLASPTPQNEEIQQLQSQDRPRRITRSQHSSQTGGANPLRLHSKLPAAKATSATKEIRRRSSVKSSPPPRMMSIAKEKALADMCQLLIELQHEQQADTCPTTTPPTSSTLSASNAIDQREEKSTRNRQRDLDDYDPIAALLRGQTNNFIVSSPLHGTSAGAGVGGMGLGADLSKSMKQLRRSSVLSRSQIDYDRRDAISSLLMRWRLDLMRRTFQAWRGLSVHTTSTSTATTTTTTQSGPNATRSRRTTAKRGIEQITPKTNSNNNNTTKPRINDGVSVINTMPPPTTAFLSAETNAASTSTLPSRSTSASTSTTTVEKDAPALVVPDVVARTGLRNLGNTCYLNSVLQALYSLSSLRKFLMDYNRVVGALRNGSNGVGESDVTTQSSLSSTLASESTSTSSANFNTISLQTQQQHFFSRRDTMFLIDYVGRDNRTTSKAKEKKTKRQPKEKKKGKDVGEEEEVGTDANANPDTTDTNTKPNSTTTNGTTDPAENATPLITEELHSLFRVMASQKSASSSLVTPRSLLATIWSTPVLQSFQNHAQQDAHEFLLLLLELVHQELSVPSFNSVSSGQRQQQQRISIVDQTFGLVNLHTLTCACGNVTYRKEESRQIDLDLLHATPTSTTTQSSGTRRAGSATQQAPISIQELLHAQYGRLYPLPSSYRCDRCLNQKSGSGVGGGWQSRHIAQLPEVIVFVVNRFQWTARGGTKLHTTVTFPVEEALDMAPWCSLDARRRSTTHQQHNIADSNNQGEGQSSSLSSTRYVLSSVVAHQGSRLTSGHYSAYCVDPNSSGQWFFHVNDAVVKPIATHTVTLALSPTPPPKPSSARSSAMSLENCAYLLFYERINSSPQPSPPPQPLSPQPQSPSPPPKTCGGTRKRPKVSD